MVWIVACSNSRNSNNHTRQDTSAQVTGNTTERSNNVKSVKHESVTRSANCSQKSDNFNSKSVKYKQVTQSANDVHNYVNINSMKHGNLSQNVVSPKSVKHVSETVTRETNSQSSDNLKSVKQSDNDSNRNLLDSDQVKS